MGGRGVRSRSTNPTSIQLLAPLRRMISGIDHFEICPPHSSSITKHDHRDDANHEVRIQISGTEEPFTTQFSVEAGAVVKVTEVKTPDFCLHAEGLELDDGELEECPADYSASGYGVVIHPEPVDDHNSRWLIQPIRNVKSSEYATD